MKWLLGRGLAAAACGYALLHGAGAHARSPYDAYPEPPQALFGELFAAVQTAHIFPDGKTFADAIPKEPPARILAAYQRLRPSSDAAVQAFVVDHFSLPADVAPASDVAAAPAPLVAHIDQLWNELTRDTPTAAPYGSLLALPYPYVVPGGRFREMYYWDSYFTLLGLVQSGRRDLAQNMVGDFAHLIDTFGHVPNGVRTYYLSRSQPPFFFAMVGLLGSGDPAASFARYLPQLRREYAFWMHGSTGLRAGTARRRVVALADGSVLNRYWDDRDAPRDESFAEDRELALASHRESKQLYRDIRAAAESGWDFSSRWFADGRNRSTIMTTQVVPIDLNSLLFGLEKAIAAGCGHAADAPCARLFERRAAQRHAAVDRYLWDAAGGAYLDYRWTRRQRIARLSAATLYPLFVGMASPAQAALVGAAVRSALLRPGGIVTTPLDTGQQWDSPNGWAPIQWIAVDGLRHSDQGSLAALIACRWMAGVNHLYHDSGKLTEKYDVVDTGRRGGGGEYPAQDGFGWTNGVMRQLLDLYPAASDTLDAADCVEERAAASPSVK